MKTKSGSGIPSCSRPDHLPSLRPCVLLLVLLLATTGGWAQTYTILHSFGTNVMGVYPSATFVQGPDGTLYGTTVGGGIANLGQVFKINPDGSSYTALKDFTGNDGAFPEANLVLSGSTLYGTTANGGTNDYGIVFKVDTNGNDFAVLKEFSDWQDGTFPLGGLTLSGSTLYGTTFDGGNADYGTVFSIGIDGSGFTVLKQFIGSDGARPHGTLVLSGATLYGTTQEGGSSWNGTVFKINTDGSGFSVLKELTDSTDGSSPLGSLVLLDSTLYGTAAWGGSLSYGTVFKINTDGSGFAVLKEFDSADGVYPQGDLALSETTLYGTTAQGGVSWWGTVFKVSTDGSGFAVLKDFTNRTDGVYLDAGVMLSGTTLFGTTSQGGVSEHGTVFKVDTDGSAYTVLTNFSGSDGVGPAAQLTLSGTTLYGATAAGGHLGKGTVFMINADGSDYSILKNFGGTDDANPTVVMSDSTLYGITGNGGSNGYGTVFRMNADGSDYTVLKDFGGNDGFSPYGGLAVSGGMLYGTTYRGGSNDLGTVFSIGTNGVGFTVLKHFNGNDGEYPYGAGLLLSSNVLYGATQSGGSSGRGTVFKINTDGSGFTVLKHFTGPDGAHPNAGMALSNSTLSGTTTGGGNSGNGTVFKINTDGTDFVVLKHFMGDNGANPQSELLLSGTTLYGTTSWGGGGGHGTVFQIEIDGSNFSVLKHFIGSDGTYPYGNLALSDTTLYGTTANGGIFDCGVLFSLSPGLPTIVVEPVGQTVKPGDNVVLQVSAGGWPAPFYQWYFNGTNTLNGATNPVLALTNVAFFHSGTYTVVITNLYGSVTSAVTSLIVEDPFINTQPISQFVIAGQTCGFSVNAGGTTPLGYQWFKDGVGLADGGDISGAQTQTLTLNNVLGGNAGRYSVVVSNNYNSVTSVVANLVVVTQPELVVNGSFESPVVSSGFEIFTNIPGWTTTFGRGMEIQNNSAGAAFEGQQLVELDSDYNNGMFQQIPTIAGQTYQLAFAYSPRPWNPRESNGIDVFFDDILLASITGDGTNLSDTRWSIFSWTVVASGSSSRLEFRATGTSDSYGGYLDDVHLTPIGPATIVIPPASQTVEVGSTAHFSVLVTNSPPLAYQWFFNGTNAVSDATTNHLQLTNTQPSQGGAYTVVVSNAFAAVTSAPAMLSVIPIVERRPVPRIKVTGEAGSLLHVDYANSLSPASDWLALETVSLISTSQYCFDLTAPLPPQRFYRAWQTTIPTDTPALNLHMIPALTLRGNGGDTVRVDGINAIGPTDAWFTLHSVALTNASQLYLDVTAPEQPQRLYRLVPVP